MSRRCRIGIAVDKELPLLRNEELSLGRLKFLAHRENLAQRRQEMQEIETEEFAEELAADADMINMFINDVSDTFHENFVSVFDVALQAEIKATTDPVFRNMPDAVRLFSVIRDTAIAANLPDHMKKFSGRFAERDIRCIERLVRIKCLKAVKEDAKHFQIFL